MHQRINRAATRESWLFRNRRALFNLLVACAAAGAAAQPANLDMAREALLRQRYHALQIRSVDATIGSVFTVGQAWEKGVGLPAGTQLSQETVFRIQNGLFWNHTRGEGKDGRTTDKVFAYDGRQYQHFYVDDGELRISSKPLAKAVGGEPFFFEPFMFAVREQIPGNADVLQFLQDEQTWSRLEQDIETVQTAMIDGHDAVLVTFRQDDVELSGQSRQLEVAFARDADLYPIRVKVFNRNYVQGMLSVDAWTVREANGSRVYIPTEMSIRNLQEDGSLLYEQKVRIDPERTQVNVQLPQTSFTVPKSQVARLINIDTGERTELRPSAEQQREEVLHFLDQALVSQPGNASGDSVAPPPAKGPRKAEPGAGTPASRGFRWMLYPFLGLLTGGLIVGLTLRRQRRSKV